MVNHRIALVDRLGSVIAIAGTGDAGVTPPKSGPALLSEARCPEDVAVGPDGRVYFADIVSSRIWVLTRTPF